MRVVCKTYPHRERGSCFTSIQLAQNAKLELTAEGEEIDAREFAAGVRYTGSMPVVVPVGNPGRELAFNLGAFDMPVVSTEIAEIVSKLAPSDVERFRVKVPGAEGSYEILNAACSLDCLDEQRSEFTRWQPGDHRTDRIGQYHMISTIRIDAQRTDDHHVFRIMNWPIVMLVSDTIKDALSGIPNLGVVFKPAS